MLRILSCIVAILDLLPFNLRLTAWFASHENYDFKPSSFVRDERNPNALHTLYLTCVSEVAEAKRRSPFPQEFFGGKHNRTNESQTIIPEKQKPFPFKTHGLSLLSHQLGEQKKLCYRDFNKLLKDFLVTFMDFGRRVLGCMDISRGESKNIFQDFCNQDLWNVDNYLAEIRIFGIYRLLHHFSAFSHFCTIFQSLGRSNSLRRFAT